MTDTVCRVSEHIGATYGGSPLSAASKFLWLLHKDPFVIFDSRARRHLGGSEMYVEYVERWEVSYSSMRDRIRHACRNLLSMRLYLSKAHSLTEAAVAETAGQEWFARRVHDIFLWQAGSGA